MGGWSLQTRPAARTTVRPASTQTTGLLIVSAHDAYGIYFFKPEHGSVGWAGADYTVHGRGVLRAIEYQTERFAGATTSMAAPEPPACSPPRPA